MQHTSTLNNNISSDSNGWLNGFIGVLLFSGSMPFTKMAVLYFDPIFASACRAGIAGVLAVFCLWKFNDKIPSKKQIIPILIVALGAVIGFPVLSAIALQHISSGDSLVFVGLLPMCTAIFAVLIAKERPHKLFWLFSIIGASLVVGYALTQGAQGSLKGNILMLLAIILCGWSYAKGAVLSKTLGGWQVISWALVFCLPLSLPMMFIEAPDNLLQVNIQGWIGVLYMGVISMFVGFIFWYKGLAQGGIAQVGQLQLLQPFFGMALTAILLGESISNLMLGVTLGVILCVGASKRYAK